MDIAVKSAFWVFAFGTVGFGLLKICKPDNEVLDKYKSESKHTYASKNTQACLDVIKKASEGKSSELNQKIEELIKK